MGSHRRIWAKLGFGKLSLGSGLKTDYSREEADPAKLPDYWKIIGITIHWLFTFKKIK